MTTMMLHNNKTWTTLRNNYKLSTLYMNIKDDSISQSTACKLYANHGVPKKQ